MTTAPHSATTVAPRSLWGTVPVERHVLLVVHNATSLNRLMDILEIFAGDRRVRYLVTSDLSDPFSDDLPAHLASLDMACVPWSEAVNRGFDLVVSASHHGDLSALRGPLVVLPHGNGFGKVAPGRGAHSGAPAYGLSSEWLLDDVGAPIADALVLSHHEQLDRMAREVPAALPRAVVCGDPAYDRMAAGRAAREGCRRALGVPDGRRIVLLSSTWGEHGLLGRHPDLPDLVTTRLPPGEFRVALVAHPNIWSWYGGAQLRSWFARALRAGMLLVPPLEGWQSAVVAADCLIGDHGSVSVYAAALGVPVLLPGFAAGQVVAGTAVDALGRVAPRLEVGGDLHRQVEHAADRWTPEAHAAVRDLVTSVPGECLARLRQTCYRLLDLPEPESPVEPEPLPSAQVGALRGA